MVAKLYKSLIISIIVLILVLFTGLFTGLNSVAQNVTNNVTNDVTNVVDVHFFYSVTCPHCAKQKPLMHYIDEHNEEVTVDFIEVSEEPEKWAEFRSKYNIPSGAIPRTFVGDKSFIGYTESEGNLEENPVYLGYIGYRNQIINAIEAEVGHKLNLPGDNENQYDKQDKQESKAPKIPWQVFLFPLLYSASYLPLKNILNTPQKQRYWLGGLIAVSIVSAFSFISLTPDTVIKNFAQTLPFPFFVFIVALADGFNPCAFTVLIILLSLLTYTKSRTDMTLIGTTFIATSAIMYFIFIMLMVMVGSVFLENYGKIFMLILGTVITVAGIINIKDYFFFKQAFSLSLSKEQQLTITKKAGKIVRNLKSAEKDKKMFMVALGGTVLLAVFVNLVELGCTAILPVVYMTSLVNYCTPNNWLCNVGWTGFYSLVYIIPLFAILLNFIYSFKSARITEDQGRILKLFGGTFMLFFGLIMIFKPSLLTFG